MAGGGKGCLERLRRAVFTVFFMLTMMASLMVLSVPVLVAVGDVLASMVLASRFACARCYGLREHLQRYGFRTSLMDIPLLSVVRSLVVTCVYSWYEGTGLMNGPYLGIASICSSVSVLILCVKACLYSPTLELDDEAPSTLSKEKLHLKMSWGMAVLFLSSLVFALGHVVVAYRTTTRARRKLLYHRLDPETALLSCKNVFSGFQKVPRSPTPCLGKFSKSNSDFKRKPLLRDEDDQLPVSLLADVDSLFVACEGIVLHYKISPSDSPLSIGSSPFIESNSSCSPASFSPLELKVDRSMENTPKTHMNKSFSNQFSTSTLYAPLLAGSATSPTFFSEEIPELSLDDTGCDTCLPSNMNLDIDVEDGGRFGIVLVHGFGGGVFSWRHITGVLARQVGCTVVAFDRPGWGLTSRPRRKDWEKKQLPNPYKLESQVDLLLSFCSYLGFTSVVLVGHDDGGLLALKAAEKVRASSDPNNVDIRGVVLLGVSLSREVVPAFARILLHTSLGKKHMVRPLLRTEITQVINRRAWYDTTKLTAEVLSLYKAPLFVEGWDEALHEIGRLSFATVLSPQNAEALLKSMQDLPVLVVAGAEDALVSLKSAQAMASMLVNSRLVAISGCGHLPHEECPKALLAALSPFISRLLLSQEVAFQRQ